MPPLHRTRRASRSSLCRFMFVVLVVVALSIMKTQLLVAVSRRQQHSWYTSILPTSFAWVTVPSRKHHGKYYYHHPTATTKNTSPPLSRAALSLPTTGTAMPGILVSTTFRRWSSDSPTTSMSLSLSVSFASHDASNSNSKPEVNSKVPTTTLPSSSSSTKPPNERAVLLNRCLDAVLNPSTLTSTTSSRSSSSSNENENETGETTTTSPSQHLMEAALLSLRDPSNGYDPRYGRPALRAYRSFVYPKKEQKQLSSTSSSTSSSSSDGDGDGDTLQMEAAAKRTAYQIDFLVKRQTSRRTEAVRNHDAGATNADGSPTTRFKFPITVVLDNLRGSFNVGSIFRTAEACGVSEIFTCGITPHPFGSGAEKVAKSALGADELVPTRHFGTTLEALRALRERRDDPEVGTLEQPPPFVVALETTSASQLYTSVDYRPYYNKGDNRNNGDGDGDDDSSSRRSRSRGIALILGNEVTGVDVELLAPLLRDEESEGNSNCSTSTTSGEALIDAIVELPTHGQKNSLNVAAVAPVILYEILRQWDSTNRNGT